MVDRRTVLKMNAVAVAAVAIAALLPIAVATYLLTVDASTVAHALRLPEGSIEDLSAGTRFIAILLSLPAVAPLSWGLLRVRVCFIGFAKGVPFAAPGIAALRDFALGMGLAAVGKPVSTTLLSPLLSWGAPAGKRQIVFTLDSDVLILALFTAIIGALA